MQSMSAENPLCPNQGIRVLQPFQFDYGTEVVRGFQAGTNRVYLKTSNEGGGGGLPVYDRDLFIDEEGNPLPVEVDSGFVDPKTGQCLESLEGYVQGTCGGETHKLISKGSFQLKGGGWFRDGY
jgi:hypothetical protein